MEKNNVYQTLKKYLESGNIEDLNEVVNFIGKTNFSKTIGIHYNTFRKRINHPEDFSIKQLKKLADLIQVEPQTIINLILENLTRKDKKNNKK